MPEIARFFGIIITISMEVEEVHQIPHFHARYGEYHASYSIDPFPSLREHCLAVSSV